MAEVELALGRPAAASEAALRSLELDAYRDASWRVLIAAHRAAGSTAAADRARRDYDRMIRAIDG
jgi:DNA-binding SARP family transcriptional activator